MSFKAKLILILFAIFLSSGSFPKRLFATVFSGYVYDIVTKNPIPGALIEIGNAQTPQFDSTTDSKGYWEVKGLQNANDYTICASATGYASEETLFQAPPGSFTFYLKAPMCGYLVETINRGEKHYEFNGAFCVLSGGEVSDGADFFPDRDASNSTIVSFLALLGAGTDKTTAASEMWTKIKRTWEWLRDNALSDNGDPAWDQADALIAGGNGWPSIGLIAETYMTYGFIPWGTCMSRAQILTTLLYRAGIPEDRLAIAETSWKFRYSQHMYSIVYLTDRWLYFDPTYIHYDLNEFGNFQSVPIGQTGYRDYCHPSRIMQISSSGLSFVPEVTDRTINSEKIVIVAPPYAASTADSMINVFGAGRNQSLVKLVLNGISFPASGETFQAPASLSCGENALKAEMVSGGESYVDTITVYRRCSDAAQEEPANGIWKSMDRSFSFYLQKYQTGSCVIVVTPGSRSYTAFLDSDMTDGISATDDLDAQGKTVLLRLTSPTRGWITVDTDAGRISTEVELVFPDMD